MIDRILELPLLWAWVLLWCVCMLRANLTHWIGRGLSTGAERSRFAWMLRSPMYLSAQRMAERWGVIAVPLSFLTIGVQSFVQLWAGVARMPLRLYLPAVMVGSAIWATIYATVGLAVFAAWIGAGGGWAVAAVVAVAALVLWRRSREHGAAAENVHADADAAGGNREVRDSPAQGPQELPASPEPLQEREECEEREVLVAGGGAPGRVSP